VSTAKDILSKAGFNSIGMCSTLWVNPDGAFRAGLFQYRVLLHLAVSLRGNRYWVISVATESIEICLRGRSSLLELASGYKHANILCHKRMIKARWLDWVQLWWVLRANRPKLLPNYYYIWNEYCFSDKTE
jgi:hypothetical protein